MPPDLIQDNTSLVQLCNRLRGQAWIAVDTEFMRTKTYYARLCLIQVATPDLVACVDPLALTNIDPLLDILYSPSVIKVLHSGRQDLEVFADLRMAPPAPVFDTQIAAALCGHEDQAGYATLVEAITSHKLPKLHTRADWEARPLPLDQLIYAEDDVRYLRDVYLSLAQKLETLGRSAWLAEECAALTDPALYRNDVRLAYLRIRQGQALTPAAQTVLRELAAWRERAAQTSNLPRGWVVTDATLVEAALTAPENLEQLGHLEGFSAGAIRKWGSDILQAVRHGKSLSPARLWDKPVRLEASQQNLYARLQARARDTAVSHGISLALLATRKDLHKLLFGDADTALAHGWRRGLIGETLLQMREEHYRAPTPDQNIAS